MSIERIRNIVNLAVPTLFSQIDGGRIVCESEATLQLHLGRIITTVGDFAIVRSGSGHDRFEQIKREFLDEDLTEMLRSNPDVVYAAFHEAFFRGAIRMFQRDNELRSIVLTDAEARDKATRHFFNRALQEVRDTGSGQGAALKIENYLLLDAGRGKFFICTVN